MADTDGSGNLTGCYVRVGDELLAVMRPGTTAGTWTTRFVHHDGLGSVRVLTDESGTTIDSRAYEAFGTKNVEAGGDPLTYGFAEEPFEGTSKLAYHRARWMDARVGRFAGMDPYLGDPRRPTTLHRYLYAANLPVSILDPSGRDFDLASFNVAEIGEAILNRITEIGYRAAGNAVFRGAVATASIIAALPEDEETQILEEAEAIFTSPATDQFRQAVASGSFEQLSFQIGNRVVFLDPHLPAQLGYNAMVDFENGNFYLGSGAFSSVDELAKTILQELFRLVTSQGANGVGQELAAQETEAASAFADRFWFWLTN